jgi:serine/threonine-protein kinase
VDEAVRIAREVADALDYAHGKGIIHRDIKPENILIQNGRPMVADFGIALAVSAAAGGRMTETGLSLGTPHYMSPEQATAEKEISARSDVYSLASVLFEMLAGQPPHLGGSAQQIIMKIIAEPVRPVTTLRKSVPPNVAAALAKALEKLPADRFESAKAFAEALGNPTFAVSTAASNGGDPRTISWKERAAVPFAFVAVVSTAALVWSWTRPEPGHPVARYYLGLPDSAQIGGNYARIGLSPDGLRLVYRSGENAGAELWLRERDKLGATKLAGTTGARAPFVSPDGLIVAYYVNRSLWTVSLQGGPPRLVSTGEIGEYGGSWGSDGTLVMDGPGPSGLVKGRATPGAQAVAFTQLDTARGESDHVFPDVLPNGKGVLFVVRRGAFDTWEIAVADTRTGKHRILTRGVHARFARSGHLLIVTSSGELTAAAFDQAAMQLTGAPVALDEQVGLRGSVRAADLAITTEGTLVYSPQGAGAGGQGGEPTWVERDGRATPVAANWTETARFPDLSPDGTQLALSIQDDKGLNLWVHHLTRGTNTKLSHEGSINWRPAWMGDSRRLTYMSDRRAFGEAFLRRLDGSDTDSLLLTRPLGLQEVMVTRDDQWLVYREGANASSDLYARRLAGDTTPIALATSEFLERNPEVSPDGRYLAYASDETGRVEVYLRPFPNAGDGKWPVSTAGGMNPLWSQDGRELFYRSDAGDLMSVDVTSIGTPPIGQQRVLFSALPYLFEPTHRMYDVTGDGKQFVMMRRTAERMSASAPLVVVENFFEELRRRVPR